MYCQPIISRADYRINMNLVEWIYNKTENGNTQENYEYLAVF